MRAKAEAPPIFIRAAARVPSCLKASMPKMKERAIHSPPATTRGSMWETPVIRCL